ncbi:fasciclin-1 isoform X2 [Culicoides brevitarsis]|uniref:fasciclin-1 isoform X2 n=1 Tax=Culicoides brevitarsis TaxID=469753 RepID=UPI00307BBD95
MKFKIMLGVVLTTTLLIAVANGMTLEEKIRDDSDLSQFYSLLERNPIALATLRYRPLTIFAPTNQAFQRFKGNTSVLYHISTVARTLDHLGSQVLADLDGNPPLYVTRKRVGKQDDIYINHALILRSRSNVQLQNKEGKKQVLHVIDDVLEPLTMKPTAPVEIYNPDAWQFLTHSESLEIGTHRVRSFRQRIIMNKKDKLYSEAGGHTFFVPVEEGFKPSPRPDLIDKKVIDGHVIPNKVIFTSSAAIEEPYYTLAFEDNLKVTVSFFTQHAGKETKTYVKSNTVIGDSKHSAGVVMAEIVKANIPVKNGVMHLIYRPLMVVDNSVKQFLEENEAGPFYKFYEAIVDHGGDFIDHINKLGEVTLFVPSNEAWENAEVKNVVSNKQKFREILNMHVVPQRITTNKIKSDIVHKIFQVPTLAGRRFLYFNAITNDNDNITVTVEGGGVNATLEIPDIAVTNGFVHIIDHVLGIPYATVQEKLATDPMLNATNLLGSRGFNAQLNDTQRRFTYFVPRDYAWNRLQIDYPSLHKKLFMRDFAYHARNVLERHLVIADRAFTMADLNKKNETIILPTQRDSLKIRVKEEDKGYYIYWNQKWIHVFRPDVECTNGIIHVIDTPLLEEADVTVAGVSTATTLTTTTISSALPFMTTLVFTLIARMCFM